ncbi:RNA polymerase sporulation-specific sigma factor [Hathewaya proteolytica DSM 3090]|uniref:RNA polymerase sigma factor n=1 Tax=Hathewaya proteolytica DSM 3090 TaxID=1121331 RepID=A0A1M6P9W6_9CLOT|nr:RNA polymerase sporulation sigma factor SigF [Hathewaya proteolytica]SHK04771.1 RNA polymerase sporulation-specific sigma factor [Hathewaya proteolytica DSM 3090]
MDKSMDYDENTVLIDKAKNGDREAMNRISEMNFPLVASICKKFLNRGYEYDDLFQIGCIGLVKAVNNFDNSFNVKFSTYAVPMIMGEIRRFLRDDGILKVSRSVKNTAKQLHYDREKLTSELGREPSIDELARYCHKDKDEILFALEALAGPQYLYDVIHQDDGSPVLLIDKVGSTVDEGENLIDRLTLQEILNTLDQRSRQVIALRYFKDQTQIEVAKAMGISQVQVSRIEKRVLKQLKEKLSG